MPSHTIRRLRPWVQLLIFVIFIVLVVRAGGEISGSFFYLNPLTSLATTIAGQRVVPLTLLALLTLLATLALGRVWCGWICPLGTVLDWTPARRADAKQIDPGPRWRQVKYFLLTLILIAALIGNLTFLILDPITILYRALATAIWPATIYVVTAAETALYRVPFLRGPVDVIEAVARGTILPVYQPLYGLNVLVTLFFAGILALNAVRARFWCRYLCPLGALLGLVSKVAWLRRIVGNECIECHRCARACPTGTIDPARDHASDPSECIMCLECVPTCSRAQQHFAGHWRPAAWRPYDPSRRQLLASTGAAVAMAGLFGAEPAAGHEHPFHLRPPGVREHQAEGYDFLAQCIRCGVCLKVCPTSGLQPSLTEAGWAGLWTPVLVSRLGYCDYSCTACGQACPVGAIPQLTLEEKRQRVIGHATIDHNRCLPWADAQSCIVCEEMCPIANKAIKLEEVEVRTADGETVQVKRPHVVRERCIGCGICENHCPLSGDAAIRVVVATDVSVIA
jgi:MauM/NapG family ferredoxin protein